MYASLGDLTVEVSGADKEWVREAFEESWSNRLAESSEMKDAIREADVSTQ
jgi:hypothetical protein